MVNGNWQRRLELAAKRKEDRKAELERRKSGPGCTSTPSEVRAWLLSCKALKTSDLLAWLTIEPGPGGKVFDKDVCEVHFRTQDCAIKRCKYSHEDSLAGVRGVPETAAPEAGKQPCLPPLTSMPLRDTAAAKAGLLRFVVYGDELAFDADNGDVFGAFVERYRVPPPAAAASAAAASAGAGAPAAGGAGEGAEACGGAGSADGRPTSGPASRAASAPAADAAAGDGLAAHDAAGLGLDGHSSAAAAVAAALVHPSDLVGGLPPVDSAHAWLV